MRPLPLPSFLCPVLVPFSIRLLLLLLLMCWWLSFSNQSAWIESLSALRVAIQLQCRSSLASLCCTLSPWSSPARHSTLACCTWTWPGRAGTRRSTHVLCKTAGGPHWQSQRQHLCWSGLGRCWLSSTWGFASRWATWSYRSHRRGTSTGSSGNPRYWVETWARLVWGLRRLGRGCLWSACCLGCWRKRGGARLAGEATASAWLRLASKAATAT